jgi:putative methionine-R-sulfoxide reductase with GAF domain
MKKVVKQTVDMDLELIAKVIISNPLLTYGMLVLMITMAVVFVWRAKKGDRIALWGIVIEPNKTIHELKQTNERMSYEYKRSQMVIESVKTLSEEITAVLYGSQEDFERQRRAIYTYFLSQLVAVMTVNKANNPRVCVFVSAGDGTLKVHEAAAHTPEGMKKLRLSIDDSAAGYTYRTGEVYFSGDIHAPGNRFKAHPKAQKVYHSLICVPIKTGERVIGILSVTGDEQKTYSDAEKIYLQAFANVLAPLLHLELYGSPWGHSKKETKNHETFAVQT